MIPRRPRLLLETCLGPAATRTAAWDAWLRETSFDAVDPVSYDLLPAVSFLNRDTPMAHETRLRGVFRHNWAANRRLLTGTMPVLSAWEQAGLEPVLLKGAALSIHTYGSLGARRFSDVDVWIEPRDFPEALALAQGLGFSPLGPVDPATGATKSWDLRSPHGHSIDLHSRPLAEAASVEHLRDVRTAAEVMVVDGLPLRRLSPEAALIVALAHGSRYDGRGYWTWILDASLLARRPLDERRFRAWATAWDLSACCSEAFRVASAVDASLGRFGPWRSRLSERIEHAFRRRAPDGLLGALPNLYFLYRRDRDAGFWRRGFGDYLRDAWSDEGARSLSGLLLRKTGRRLRATLGRRAPG